MTIDEQISILQAAKEGKIIEWFLFNKGWHLIVDVVHHQFDFNNNNYRIKPEPKYKPYDKPQIEWLGKVVKEKNKEYYAMITQIDYTDNLCSVLHGAHWSSIEGLFENYTWADGSPIGEVVK